MPLVAIVEGVRTVSSLLSDGEWAALKKDVQAKRTDLSLRCGQAGHLKSTRKGTRFFAHNPGSGHECDSTGETQQHLRAKDIIVKAAVAAGWDAQPEVRGDGWVADVMATKGGVQIAFEVQWSNQSDADFEHRQDRYKRDGVRGAWFVRHSSSIPPVPSAAIPLFRLAEDGEDMVAFVGGKQRPLTDAVTLLLSGRVKHREYVSSGEPVPVNVRGYKNDCWKCAHPFLIWTVESFTVTGNCGREQKGWLSYELFADQRIENTHGIREAVAEAAATQALPVGRLMLRSTQASGTRYLAFVCPGCNATCGDFFIQELLMEGVHEPPLLEVTAPLIERGVHAPHWCVDQDAGHCAVPPDGYTPDYLGPVPQHAPDDDQAVGSVNVQMVGEGGITMNQAISKMLGGGLY